jgi:hypothetical protein
VDLHGFRHCLTSSSLREDTCSQAGGKI